MKLRILLLVLAGAAGVTASLALANDGKPHFGRHVGTTPPCQRVRVFGTASAPQTFTVTVGKARHGSSFSAGQVVTVTVGSSGQSMAVGFVGCANGSSVSSSGIVLNAFTPRPTTTATTTAATTTTVKGHGHDGDDDGHHGKHHKPPVTTTATTTTATTTTGTTATTTTTGP